MELEPEAESATYDNDGNDTLDNLLNQFEQINNSMSFRQKNIIEQVSKVDNKIINNLILNLSKNTFSNHINNKLNKLYQKIRILEKKYSSYKKCYDCVNIGIILTSTLLTLIETIKVEFNDSFTAYCRKYLNLTPIIFSSIITCSASIIKFKKYQENMELISKTIDKGTFCIAQLKKCREHICFCDTKQEYDIILDKYNNDLYDNYSACFQSMERLIKNSDYEKYLEKIFYTDYKVHKLEKQRKCFFEKYSNTNCDEITINVNKPHKNINCCFV